MKPPLAMCKGATGWITSTSYSRGGGDKDETRLDIDPLIVSMKPVVCEYGVIEVLSPSSSSNKGLEGLET
jgi:hypothetical protein